MNRSLSYFGGTKAERHSKKSKSTFNVFKKLVSELTDDNKNITKDIESEDEAIRKANESKASMQMIKANNDKFINKINKFFELD